MADYFYDLEVKGVIPAEAKNPWSPESRYIPIEDYQIDLLVRWREEDRAKALLSNKSLCSLMDIRRAVIWDLEKKGIEPTEENILKRLEELTKVIPEG